MMAVGRSHLSQPFLVKLLHQILPLGKLIHKYDPVKYTIDCPTCREHIETYDHLFQCHHPSPAGWKTQFRDTLIKFTNETNCHHLLQDILVTGIHNWIALGYNKQQREEKITEIFIFFRSAKRVSSTETT
jgi:hypothetical protein